MDKILNFLKEAGTYYLATMDGDQPRVRPFGTIEVFDGKLCIQTGKAKDCFKQIAKNPKVELCAFHNGVWVRVCGELQLDDRREAKKHMLDNYPSLRAMYSEDDDNTAVLCMAHGTAVFSSFTSAPETVEF